MNVDNVYHLAKNEIFHQREKKASLKPKVKQPCQTYGGWERMYFYYDWSEDTTNPSQKSDYMIYGNFSSQVFFFIFYLFIFTIHVLADKSGIFSAWNLEFR